MVFDFSPYFKRYESILKMADQVFEKVLEKHPEGVRCKKGCADCCHALFDLTLIEAIYLNHHFQAAFTGDQKERLLEKANLADRRIHKLKRRAYRETTESGDDASVLEDLARMRERCPLLNDRDLCELYRYRPVTCRIYGIPTAINGKGHTCGLSGFLPGESYATVNLDQFQRMLYDLSAELVKDLKSRHLKLPELLVPLSMALLTEYDEDYLGHRPLRSERGREGRG